jgi:hypothetical protein
MNLHTLSRIANRGALPDPFSLEIGQITPLVFWMEWIGMQNFQEKFKCF